MIWSQIISKWVKNDDSLIVSTKKSECFKFNGIMGKTYSYKNWFFIVPGGIGFTKWFYINSFGEFGTKKSCLKHLLTKIDRNLTDFDPYKDGIVDWLTSMKLIIYLLL